MERNTEEDQYLLDDQKKIENEQKEGMGILSFIIYTAYIFITHNFFYKKPLEKIG